MPKVTLPTLDAVKSAMHRFIDERLELREYKGTKYFGTPFEDASGNNTELVVGDVVGTPKISFGRMRPTTAVSMATKAAALDVDNLDDNAAVDLLKRLEAKVYGEVQAK